MSVVTTERTRACIRCHERFTEPAGTVTRICGDCSGRGTGAPLDPADGNDPERGRKRTCVRCGDDVPELSDEASRRCPSCDPDHVVLD